MSETLGLTDLQIEIMRVLWTRGEATVLEVHRELHPTRRLAQATVATLLARLEKKGVLEHRSVGRQFVFRARVSEAEVRRAALVRVADRLFGGDIPALVRQLLGERPVGPGELDEIRALLAAREREMGGTADGAP